jgi:hypothetical protein
VADFVFNLAKGRAGELTNRVKVGDPSAARLYIIPVDVAAVSDATLRDLDDFAAIITAGVTERSATGWNRKTVAAADITTPAPDDANDRFDYDMIDQTWTAVTAGNVTDLIVCYASVASPTNAQLLPLVQLDFAITPDGSDVVAQINASGFYRAA